LEAGVTEDAIRLAASTPASGGRKPGEAEDPANGTHAVKLSAKNWDAIKISFVSDERVQIHHKQGLLEAPVFGISRALVVPKRANMELGYTLRSFFEIRFRMRAIFMGVDGSIVLGAKFGAEPLRLPLVHVHPHRHANRKNGDYDEDYHGRTKVGQPKGA
jgi:hypothetical protein